MNKRQKFHLLQIIACAVVAVIGFAWFASMSGNTDKLSAPPLDIKAISSEPSITATSIATLVATPTFEIIDRRYILAGKTLDEIAQYAVEHLVPAYLRSQGTIDVLLSRTITRNELTELGLGCLPNAIPIQEPPYVLVILGGSFRPAWSQRSIDSLSEARHYAAFVIDVWAAGPTAAFTSGNGGIFREALNDPTLPDPGTEYPSDCPPPIYTNRPHGAVVPGIRFPTALPQPTQLITPTIPPPVETVPVPTSTVQSP